MVQLLRKYCVTSVLHIKMWRLRTYITLQLNIIKQTRDKEKMRQRYTFIF